MFKRVVFATVLAAGLFAISAAQRTDSGNGPIARLADMRTDDPYPCPDCDPNSGNGPTDPPSKLTGMRTDDPYPCPDCDPNSGNGPTDPPAKLTGMRTDD